eukprot:TRINITY_DN4262_c0_g1_i1.p1 TRINITY_DN4262_c0_g1~~TRINITY_DN4262_c0_g1_i1.p1  ORF type:complete len:496 (-),score=109.23 TRINITY_DN4262_c0_g1_i1:96-1583(-)
MRSLALPLFSLLLILFLVSLVNGDSYIRVSHQVSRRPDLAIDVRVDGASIDQFNDLVYTDTSVYVAFPEQEQYFMTIYVSGTDFLLFNWTCELAPNSTASFFVAQNRDFEFEGLVYTSQTADPPQYSFNYRVINLATTRDVVGVIVNDQQIDTLGFDQESVTQTLVAAVYTFVLVNTTNQAILLSSELTLRPGNDYSIIINFVGGTTKYEFQQLIDFRYPFSACQIRGINAIPEGQVLTLRIVQELLLYFESDLDYSAVSSAYSTIPPGLYAARWWNSSREYIASRPFYCESSNRYSIVISGDSSLGEDVTVQVFQDSNFAPLNTQSSLRVVLLSPSPSASPANITLQGENAGEVFFPDATSYLATTGGDVSIVLEANGQILVNSNLNLEPGTSYSLLVFGLVDGDPNSDLYPIISSLVADFQAEDPSTSSTTGSTTGTIIDDFDDDSGLSGGHIAGIVVGVVVGVILFGGMVCFLKRRKRRGQQDPGYVQFQQS